MNKRLLAFLAVVVLLSVASSACKSKGATCTKVTHALDPVATALDAAATGTAAATPPSPGDQASCALLTEELRRLESAQGTLSLIISDDATLAKHLAAYRGHVDDWTKSVRAAQGACLTRDGNAMTTAMSDAIRHRSQLAPARNDVTTYCQAP